MLHRACEHPDTSPQVAPRCVPDDFQMPPRCLLEILLHSCSYMSLLYRFLLHKSSYELNKTFWGSHIGVIFVHILNISHDLLSNHYNYFFLAGHPSCKTSAISRPYTKWGGPSGDGKPSQACGTCRYRPIAIAKKSTSYMNAKTLYAPRPWAPGGLPPYCHPGNQGQARAHVQQ